MFRPNKFRSLVMAASTVVASALALPACGGGGDGEVVIVPAEPVGTLTLLWTVAGTTDPFACIDLGADDLELVVFDVFEEFVVEAEAPCEDFELSVDLIDDDYSADVTLVDFADRPATVTRTIDDIVILGGTDLVIDVDFPLDSFL